MATLAVPLPLLVVSDLLGIPPQARAQLQVWAGHLLAPEPSRAPRARDTLAHMSDIVAGILAAKRAEPGDDLVSELIAAEDHGDRLSENELTSMLFYLIFVWYEVCVDLIANGLLTLLLEPARLAQLRERPEWIPLAVEELLRYESPQVFAAPRFPVEDVEIAGVRIPAGDTVLLALAAANRDPDRFTHPHVVDLERDPAHLGFGAGIHMCLGAPLVRMQTAIVLRQLLQRLPVCAWLLTSISSCGEKVCDTGEYAHFPFDSDLIHCQASAQERVR